jgi:Tol biopolymer transport system component
MTFSNPHPTARRRLRLLTLATLLVLLVMLAAPAQRSGAATFGAAQVVSFQGSTLAADAFDPQIASGGQYVVFDGTQGGVQGVYEKNLQTGVLNLVAGTQGSSLAAFSAPDAGSPSVSSDGRYVAFTTTIDLDPADDPQQGASCANVYVRDMDVPVGQSGAYTLASALDGQATGLAYTLNSTGTACATGGSASADGVAISADGNEVAFTVTGQSDLVSGDASDPTTPVNQVAVRYLNTQQTMLVSQTEASEHAGATPEAVPDGAALTSNGAATNFTNIIDGLETTLPFSASTAAISADGSTVAWYGIDIDEQAAGTGLYDDVNGNTGEGGDVLDTGQYAAEYDEPLWRDIAAGSSAPTRRVTGGDDPAALDGHGPFATSYDPGADPSLGYTGPQYGTYTAPYGFSNIRASLDQVTPSLSANGQEVAFLATAPLTTEVPTLGFSGSTAPDDTADAYVVNMASGLTRSQALTQLTDCWTGSAAACDTTLGVSGIAISADGSKAAFATAATSFLLSWPALITPSISAQPTYGASQLYEVDLTAGTLSMATYGYDNGPANGAVASPSFTADGNTLAFASGATNLVYGVATAVPSALTEVFTLAEDTVPELPGTQTIDPLPAGVTQTAKVSWLLSVTTSTSRSGVVTVHASVPAGGKLSASAKALAPAGAKAKVVASASRKPTRLGVFTLTLKPGKRYTSLLRHRDGLAVDLHVGFSAKGHKALNQTLQLTLRDRVKVKAHAKAKRKQAKAGHKAKARRKSEIGGRRR